VGAITIAAPLPATGLFADNTFRAPGGPQADEVVNPATEETIGRVAAADAGDVDTAISAARRAVDAGPWSRLSPRERSDALYRLAEVLASDYDRILAVVIAETGCPVTAARAHQVGIPLRHMEYWAEAARRPKLMSRDPVVTTRANGSGVLGSWVVRREPYGVVVAITPYNFPFLQTVMKMGPALAAGNAMVVKPSPLTPFSTFLLAEAAQRADLPPGAFNVVAGGAEVGDALVSDPRVDLVSFTGSAAVGSLIAGRAATRLTRVVLELGGKSALIVCEDADLAQAVRAGVQSATYHAGQGCALTTRHLVHRRVWGDYVERLTEELRRVPVGDPTDPRTGMGPLIRPMAVDRVDACVHEAARRGATVAVGGSRGEHPRGYFYQPTLLTGVANTDPVAREEIFGPVIVAMEFGTEDDAVELANDSPYGLAGHVLSADPARAFGLSRLHQPGCTVRRLQAVRLRA